VGKSAIAWTDMVWNPATGCTKVSAGCKHCYAERIAGRKLPGHGFDDRSFADVRFHPERLDAPLHWRKPRRVFVDSMSDLFHEKLTDEQIDQVFAVMALCPQHTFQILTKRAERMRAYCQALRDGKRHLGDALGDLGEDRIGTRLLVAQAYGVKPGDEGKPPYSSFSNVWLGVSASTQADLKHAWQLCNTPASIRFVSLEPLLEKMDLNALELVCKTWRRGATIGRYLDWVIVGGESGPKARPCDVTWIRLIVGQCREAGVPCFVKQLGSYAILDTRYDRTISGWTRRLRSRSGSDPAEWPEDLRVQEFPR
jgi:protein gp37